MKKEDKTNVMRILDQKRADYKAYSYESDGAVSGAEVAKILGLDSSKVFKTLVTRGKSGQYYVFVIPVEKELDLKLAASAAGEKNIEMIRSKDLLPLTGYIHGGCSPIGMKKYYPTFLDNSARDKETIVFSAGRIGRQVELAPAQLSDIIRCTFASLCSQSDEDQNS